MKNAPRRFLQNSQSSHLMETFSQTSITSEYHLIRKEIHMTTQPYYLNVLT